MRWVLGLAAVLAILSDAAAQPEAKTFVPRGIAVGADGRDFVATSDGLMTFEKDKGVRVAEAVEGPRGLVAFRDALFVAGPRQVWRVDAKREGTVHAAADAFPRPPQGLGPVAVDPENGTVYVGDESAAVFRIDPKKKVTLVTDAKKIPGLRAAGALALDGASFLLVLDAGGVLHRVRLADGTAERVADGFNGAAGLAWDRHGRLFIADRAGVSVLVRPGEKAHPGPRAGGAGGLCWDAGRQRLLVSHQDSARIATYPSKDLPGHVDETPLPVEAAVAFPKLQWTGWQGETDEGLTVPLRPMVLTHAGDGSNRVFVAIQQGTVHVFPNDQAATATKVFLDITPKVRYDDKTNEEGLLGLAFHPRHKENGEFFVFYTDRHAKMTNVLSRFRVSKDDPDRADPATEEVLLRIDRPFWNHNGGTLCFGPDGYLYVALGDGGSANDPFDNAQNLKELLGSVLRLDVDRKADGTPYAIPKDNPFVGRPDARPEIWAYGLRNVWRMAFDRGTGKLWAADVGQNLFEEINILRAGGNFGWRRREGLHPFGADGKPHSPAFVDPVWEYNHDVGKSITGGVVSRGPRVAELHGHYLYADYITCKMWALRYDETEGRVVANRPIPDKNLPILSFGEDEPGDVYFLTYTTTGQGIYRFVGKGGTPTAKEAPTGGTTIPIGEDLLQALPRRQIKLPDAGDKATVYEGVAVADLVRKAGVPTGKALKGPALAQYLLVEAADGYRVVFSLPELEAGPHPVLLADKRNGGGLDPQEGPLRLIVPQDERRSRWVRRVTRLTVLRAPGRVTDNERP